MFALLLALIGQDLPPTQPVGPSRPDLRQAERFSPGDPHGPSQLPALYEADGILRVVDPDPEPWLADALASLEPYRSQPLSTLVSRLQRADEVVPQPERSLHIWRARTSVATDEQTGGANPEWGYRTVGRTAHCTLVVEVDADHSISRFGITGEEPACGRILHWLD